MTFSPLLHGALGILDELIVVAEGVLVLVLLVMFLRSRAQKRALPPADTSHPESPAGDPAHRP